MTMLLSVRSIVKRISKTVGLSSPGKEYNRTSKTPLQFVEGTGNINKPGSEARAGKDRHG
jgi:hypothetical protein